MVSFAALLLTAIAVSFLFRAARRRAAGRVGLGRITPAPEVHRAPQVPVDRCADETRIICPTSDQAQAGLARLRACVPHWSGKPALFVEGSQTALIVRLHAVMHDAHGFQLRLVAEDVIGAPDGFDAAAGFDVWCGWHQPYMSFTEKGVSAAFGFYLHFGEAGVRGVREFWAQMRAEDVVYSSQLRGALRGSFSAAAWEEEQHEDAPHGGRTADAVSPRAGCGGG